MTKLWAITLCVLSLAGAWAGCASAPVAELGDKGDGKGDDTTSPPDPVVVGSKQDAAGPAPDDGVDVDAAVRDAGARPKDAAIPERTGEGSPPMADASGDTRSERDATSPTQLPDAGPTTPEAGNTPDAGTPPPVTPVDAGTPPPPPPVVVVVDAGQPAAPDAGSSDCLPGLYKGAFEGEISALLGVVRIDVAGDISIEVELSGEGDRLRIRNGILKGTDTSDDKNPIAARIDGVLNCATKKFESGTITDGTYNRVDPIWGGPPTTTRFEGTITGIYAPTPPTAVGTWSVKNATGTRTSMGIWNAALQ